jgi:hypothetical protein
LLLMKFNQNKVPAAVKRHVTAGLADSSRSQT